MPAEEGIGLEDKEAFLPMLDPAEKVADALGEE
jgi:hypothetical protein